MSPVVFAHDALLTSATFGEQKAFFVHSQLSFSGSQTLACKRKVSFFFCVCPHLFQKTSDTENTSAKHFDHQGDFKPSPVKWQITLVSAKSLNEFCNVEHHVLCSAQTIAILFFEIAAIVSLFFAETEILDPICQLATRCGDDGKGILMQSGHKNGRIFIKRSRLLTLCTF